MGKKLLDFYTFPLRPPSRGGVLRFLRFSLRTSKITETYIVLEVFIYSITGIIPVIRHCNSFSTLQNRVRHHQVAQSGD